VAGYPSYRVIDRPREQSANALATDLFFCSTPIRPSHLKARFGSTAAQSSLFNQPFSDLNSVILVKYWYLATSSDTHRPPLLNAGSAHSHHGRLFNAQSHL
jgi:hypothetical protein